MRKVIIFLSLLCSFSVNAADSVQLVGMFGKKAAVLRIDGEEAVVKVGQTKLGVTLINFVNKDVVVEFNDQQQQLSLSTQIGGTYKKPKVKVVRVASQAGGHYWIKGSINKFAVDFIVDTGATMISMNLSDAQRLGLEYESGRKVRLSTAGGVTEARMVMLKEVTVGEITRLNVAATVTLDNALPAILLGNSFLGSLDINIENGVLVLKSNK